MKENTVYLLYNTNASQVKLHHGLVTNFNPEIGNREWEYEDKDEFTIMYSQEDKRQYTDIKILSKTKLKERPKSADPFMRKPKLSVEGILIRKSNSLSLIEEDLQVLRRCPLIKPLLSETEIHQLQLLLEECRRNKRVKDKSETRVSNNVDQLFPDNQNLRRTAEDFKGNRPYESAKDVLSRRTPGASPQQMDANKANKKAKLLSQVGKKDNINKGKDLDKREKTPIVKSKPIEKDKKNNRVASVTQKAKLKKLDFIGARSKSEDWPKNDKRKSKQSKIMSDDGTRKNKNKKTVENQSQQDQKNSKQKIKPSNEDEHKGKKQKNPKTDSVETKKDINKIAKSKEKFSDHDKFSHSSEKTPVPKQKESKKKSNDNKKSKDDKTNFKKNKDNEISPSTSIIENTEKTDKSGKSKKTKQDTTKLNKNEDNEITSMSITEKTEKPDKSGKSKPAINLGKNSKGENRSKSSIQLSNKQNLKKGKIDQTKTPDEADDLIMQKEEGKSTQPKFSPSDKNNTKNKVGNTEKENASAKKDKTKDKLLPGTIQYMIHYILSNPNFIHLGWTLQPTEKALSRIVTFKAVPANPQSYCFRSRENIEQKFYPSGALALNIAEDGTGRINYPGGAPAIIMTKSHAGMKLTLYSCPTKDPLVKESFYTRIIGMFDSFGNGVVYSSNGKKILNFNQMEGVYCNPSKQTPYKWRWSCFKVLEAHRLKELLNTMVSEVPPTKVGKVVGAPSSGSSKKSVTPLEKKPVDKLYEALLEELPYPVMPKSKLKVKTLNSAFKSIILKINKEITLRINGQDSVAIHFSAKNLSCKMDLGVRIDPDCVARLDKVADGRVESVQSLLGDLLHPSPSLQKLNKLLDPNALH